MKVNVPPGWYADPTGQGDRRYWNGAIWTESVDRVGTTADLPIDPSQAQVPPAPGTLIAEPIPQVAPETVNVSTSKSSPWGALISVIVIVLAVIAIFVAMVNNSSDDSPTPGTDAPTPAVTEAPATPTSDGG